MFADLHTVVARQVCVERMNDLGASETARAQRDSVLAQGDRALSREGLEPSCVLGARKGGQS